MKTIRLGNWARSTNEKSPGNGAVLNNHCSYSGRVYSSSIFSTDTSSNPRARIRALTSFLYLGEMNAKAPLSFFRFLPRLSSLISTGRGGGLPPRQVQRPWPPGLGIPAPAAGHSRLPDEIGCSPPPRPCSSPAGWIRDAG